MKYRAIPLLLLTTATLSSCSRNETAANHPPKVPRLEFKETENVEFADFIRAAGSLAGGGNPVEFVHPELPIPIHFTREESEGDPLSIVIRGNKVELDAQTMEIATLGTKMGEFSRQASAVGERAIVHLSVSEDPPVTFARGLSVLRTLAESEIDWIHVHEPESYEELEQRIKKESLIQEPPHR